MQLLSPPPENESQEVCMENALIEIESGNVPITNELNDNNNDSANLMQTVPQLETISNTNNTAFTKTEAQIPCSEHSNNIPLSAISRHKLNHVR